MTDPLVEASGLAAGYGSHTVWAQASFQVHPGELVAVLGANGTGKSTLLRMLLGLLRPQAGELRVLGAAPRRGHPHIGYVPQRRSLDPGLALRSGELVRLGADGHRWLPGTPTTRRRVAARVRDALADVEAVELAAHPAGRLSGGQLQRVLLAQALVGDPRLLLLDEPLTSLDLRTQAAIAGLVGRLCRSRGLGALLVAHDVNPLLGVVDRVMYMGRGELAIGRPEEVVDAAVLSRLYDTPVEVLRDSRGRLFVVGLEGEAAHPHPHSHPHLAEATAP